MTTISRITAEVSRASEFFSIHELQAQTGQPSSNFGSVVCKELMDNALDAAETSGHNPEVCLSIDDEGKTVQIAVSDNGNGIRPEVIERIKDFNIRVSDKVIYRSPSRGQQGNALKTILGIPHAFGSTEPVTIESCSMKHEIKAGINPLGSIAIDHQATQIPMSLGTKVSVFVPHSPAAERFNPPWWVRSYALTNPHALIKFCYNYRNDCEDEHGNLEPRKIQEIYQPTVIVGKSWRKFMPTDLTAPSWYDVGTLTAQIFAHIQDDDITLRDFVRRFRGLSASSKAKEVCDRFPNIRRLSDSDGHLEYVADLLKTMNEIADPPSESILGYIGKDHIKQCFSEWFGLKGERFWYKRSAITVEGKPYVVEAAVAEVTSKQGAIFHAVNFSPTFSDPLASIQIDAEKVYGYGFRGFLQNCYIDPEGITGDWSGLKWLMRRDVAAIIHIIGPALEFTDRGKTHLSLPQQAVDVVGSVLWSVAKQFYVEGERRKKDAAKEEMLQKRLERENQSEDYVKSIVFVVLPEAIEIATDGSRIPVSSRDLFYTTRSSLQKYTDKELKWGYFSQSLLVEYQQKYGKIKGLQRDPRGFLHVPHLDQKIPLGTKKVDEYTFPEWVYDKILYIEKKGWAEALLLEKIHERYDIAIVAAEGYSTEAIRTLFQNADKRTDYMLFVLHDADPFGYNIARTLREETDRMPGYHVDVVDLGLGLEEALNMGLQLEKFTRKKALPSELDLNDIERQHFEGRQTGNKVWEASRIELNAILPRDRAAYVERKLAEHNAMAKVTPSDNTMREIALKTFNTDIREIARRKIEEYLKIDSIVERAVESAEVPDFEDDLIAVKEKLHTNPPLWWKNLVIRQAKERVDEALGDIEWSDILPEAKSS